MKYTICFDTLCTGFQPIYDEEFVDGKSVKRTPVEYSTLEEAQAEIDSDPEFYEDCFACSMDEIGHKTIYYGSN